VASNVAKLPATHGDHGGVASSGEQRGKGSSLGLSAGVLGSRGSAGVRSGEAGWGFYRRGMVTSGGVGGSHGQ
jgi:hypothetical protein